MESDTHTFSVIAGDIVGSSKLSADDLKMTLQGLRDSTRRFEEKFPDTVYGMLDVFSGDGWQLLMKRSEEVGKSQSTINQALQIAGRRSIEKPIKEIEYRP